MMVIIMMETDVCDIIDEIKTEATKRKLFLHRYSNSCCNYNDKIIYVINNSETKPEKPYGRFCLKTKVMRQKEGCSKRCEAYRELANLLRKLKNIRCRI